jgi:hypothetical protein
MGKKNPPHEDVPHASDFSVEWGLLSVTVEELDAYLNRSGMYVPFHGERTYTIDENPSITSMLQAGQTLFAQPLGDLITKPLVPQNE